MEGISVIAMHFLTSFAVSFTWHLQTWVDEHLTWDPADFGGLDEVVMEIYEIWSPDIRSWDVQERWSRSSGREPFSVNSKGLVSWWTRVVLKTFCTINLKDYPFDTQTCAMGFGCWSYDSTGVQLNADPSYPSVIYGPYQKNPEWIVLKSELSNMYNNITEKGTWHFLNLMLTLQRRNSIYKYSVFIPYFAACLFGILSFLEPIGSAKRMTFGIFSIAIFMSLLLLLANQLGSHSITVPYAVKCCGVSLAVVSTGLCMSLLLRVLIVKLSSSNVSVPRVFTSILESMWIQRIFCMTPIAVGGDKSSTFPAFPGTNQFFNESESEEIIGRNGGDTEGSVGVQNLPRNVMERMQTSSSSSTIISKDWMMVCHFIDRLCFYGFIVVALIYHSWVRTNDLHFVAGNVIDFVELGLWLWLPRETQNQGWVSKWRTWDW